MDGAQITSQHSLREVKEKWLTYLLYLFLPKNLFNTPGFFPNEECIKN